MIIKKKYTVSDSNESKESEQSENIAQHQTETEISPKEQKEENKEKDYPKAETVQQQKEEENKQKSGQNTTPKAPAKRLNPDDLDLSLDDIKFEQREERREGSRRRGYRRTQDRNVVSRAQEEARSIKEIAKQDGYKEGIENAKKEIEELKGKFEEFYKYKNEVFDKISECIFDISVEIAKKIINKETESDKTVIIQMIKAAVEEVNKTENKIVLRVMPKDAEIVKNKLPEIFAGNGFDAKISVIPDKKITEGGVIVETSNGIIDATLETQLAIIEKALCNEKKEDKE